MCKFVAERIITCQCTNENLGNSLTKAGFSFTKRESRLQNEIFIYKERLLGYKAGLSLYISPSEENLSDYSADKAPVVKGIDEAKKAVVNAINALQVKQTAPSGNQNGNADQSGNGAQGGANQNGNGAQGNAGQNGSTGQQVAGNNAGGSGNQNVSTANTGASKSDSDGVKTLKSAKVKTGDVNHGGMYAALGVLGAAILAAVLGMRKKGKFWQK